MRGFPVVLSIPLCLVATPAAALDLADQPFTVRTVRQSVAVHAVAQSPDGMLWFGSRVGVTRFDGERFVDVPVEPSTPAAPSETWVRRLRAARDGSLWMATGSGDLELAVGPGGSPRVFAAHGSSPGLVQLWPHRPPGAAGRLRSLSVASGLPNPWVWALAEDGAGGMWVGTEDGLARFTADRVERFTTADGLPSNFITALSFANGQLHVGTSAGVAVRRQGRFEPLAIREPALALAFDRAGRLWAAVHGRLLRLDAQGEVKAFAMVRPTALAVDARENLWVTGYLDSDPRGDGATLGVFVNGAPVPLSTPLAPHLLGTDLLIDREGSVWVSWREGGITQLAGPPVRNLGLEEGLSGRIAYSVLHASDGSTYAATNGGVSRWLAGRWITWADGPDIGSGPRDIAEGRPGTAVAGIWLASEGHLLRGGPAGWHHHNLGRPPFNAGAGGSRALVVARNGDVFVARRYPGPAVLRLPGGDLERAEVEVSEDEGLCPGGLNHGLETADGALWFVGDYGAHGAGVVRIADGRARCFGASDGLPDAQFGALTEDREGTVWLGTGWGRGLVRYRAGRFAGVPAKVGLPPSTITGLLDDGRGYLWICSESGVWRVIKADLHRCADRGGCDRLPADVFGKQQGMRAPECMGAFHPNMTLDRQGNVWVATLGGLSLFSPPERAQRAVLKPLVEEIAIDGVPVQVTSEVTLGPKQRTLVVRYTVASFLGPMRPALRHRLVGFDSDWIPSAAPAVAHYHNLPAGNYTLELAAGDGPAQQSTLSVKAVPPFWRTPAFVVVMVGLAAALGLALHTVRVGRIGLRHRAANQERLRIARELHDGLAQKLRAIGLLSDRLRQDQGRAEKLGQMRQILGEAHAELRRAIFDMREGTETVRVETLIEQMLSQVVLPTGVDVSIQSGEASVAVSSYVAQEAQLVAKEALANALRHSGARKIEIGVLSDEEGLHIWVKDDGRGGLRLDPDAAGQGHYGLIGMLERARALGGELTTRSEPGRGTEVSLFVPRTPRDKERSNG